MDYVTCSNCKSKTWVDRAALGDKKQTMRFKCTRCGKLIKLTGCSRCGAQEWIRENDLYEKGSRKPIVRYRCGGCGRIVGLILDHDR
ncbi:MAG: hypothetical protein JXA95_02905 [Spirochaetales bacterium]|nr:hypothetical protein [Spirochaetales bacterium]